MAKGLKSFPCPTCGAAIDIRAAGISITFGCQSCGSIINDTDQGFKVLRAAVAEQRAQEALPFPIGARGKLDEVTWEVIGFVRRRDKKWLFTWDEYLLFNPFHGFRFLIHSDEHFAIAMMLTAAPEITEKTFKTFWKNQKFSLYHRGTAEVIKVHGEFYWRVKRGEQTEFADLIAPPFCLTVECHRSDNGVAERSISLARYLSRAEIAEGFGIAEERLGSAPRKIFPFQPNPCRQILPSMALTMAVSLAILLLFQLKHLARSTNDLIYQDEWPVTGIQSGAEIPIGELHITSPINNLAIESFSPVDNSWVEVNYELESTTGDSSAWTTHAIEYYYGWDSDGRWSEGGQRLDSVITDLDLGDYKLIATVDSQTAPLTVATTIRANVPIWSNFVVTVLLILLGPILCAIRALKFEHKRWEESDFSPFERE